MQEANSIWIAMIGVVVILATLINALLRRLGVPSLVGYIALGMAVSALDERVGLITAAADHSLEFLAQMGLVVLLFRVGLESRPRALARELPRASLIGLSNIVIAALSGYAAARYWLDLGLVTSLTVATALTATSVGVALAPWEEHGALDNRAGRILLDVAELDDIVSVILLGLLLAVIPALQQGNGELWGILGSAAISYAAKFFAFAAGCLLFARYLERYSISWTARVAPEAGVVLTLFGMGTVIAALAGWLGFSLAIGALFAGLVFSQDPQAIRSESGFNDLYVFFVPFFFIGIGRDIELGALLDSWAWGLALLVVAVLGKLVSTGLAAWPLLGRGTALLLAVSMVPRAEIAMVVAQQGRSMGVVSAELYAALVVVTAATVLGTPLVLRPLLARLSPS